MKKMLFLLLLFASSLPARAQNTFAPVGAEWWYGGLLWSYEYWDFYTQWADRLVSVKDTTVAGKPCRMLAATRYQKDEHHITTSYVSQWGTYFIYNNEDTVFCYDETISDFTPLYIFNVQQGDTLCLRQPNSLLSNPEFCIVIDSVVMETYDTTLLRSYYNHNISGTPLNWGFSVRDDDNWNDYKDIGKYTEKIGGNWDDVGSFFPAFLIHNPDYYKQNLLPTGTFRCYHDPAVSIKMASLPCDTINNPFLNIEKTEHSKLKISLYPNPSTGNFTLETKQSWIRDATILITDLSGRKIWTALFPAGKNKMGISPDKLQTGIYFLVLDTDQGKYYQKIIIRH